MTEEDLELEFMQGRMMAAAISATLRQAANPGIAMIALIEVMTDYLDVGLGVGKPTFPCLMRSMVGAVLEQHNDLAGVPSPDTLEASEDRVDALLHQMLISRNQAKPDLRC